MGTQQGWLMLPYPVGANRVWRVGNGRVIPNHKAEVWKRTTAILASAAGIRITSAEVHIHYRLHPRQNKDGSASKSRLDVDAPAKALLDALNGVAWHDDKQVVRLLGEIGDPVPDGGLSVMISEGINP